MRLWLFVAAVAVLLIGFVASPCFAQAQQPGWVADPQSGCRVWSPFPEIVNSVTWSGGCQNGLAEGTGIAQWFESGQPSTRLKGMFRDGKPNGHGVATYLKGDHYEGEFRDGLQDGHGVYTSANGDRYDGEFRNDKLNGRGVYTFADGDRYEGEFRDGEQSQILRSTRL
jgi:hypothetical protein